jgi:hypothetical protein
MKKAKPNRNEIAAPDVLLAAAKAAPRVFSMGEYYHAIRIMREKGRSWRQLQAWLRQFNIRISHAHLRRLFVVEDERLSRLTAEEWSAAGMPPDMIRETLEKDDPTKRLTAPDPEEAIIVRQNIKKLREVGWPDSRIRELFEEADETQSIDVEDGPMP